MPTADDPRQHAVQVCLLSPEGAPAADDGHRPEGRLLGDAGRVEGARAGRVADGQRQRTGRVADGLYFVCGGDDKMVKVKKNTSR